VSAVLARDVPLGSLMTLRTLLIGVFVKIQHVTPSDRPRKVKGTT